MAVIKIKKGLDVPIAGIPSAEITNGAAVENVALLGDDYHGLKLALLVKEGQRVQAGEALFFSRKNPDIKFTAPVSGTVESIHRGERRRFISMVLTNEGGNKKQFFSPKTLGEIKALDSGQIKNNLLESGLWTAMRERPFACIANPSTSPSSIFVNAMDTSPLAPDVAAIVNSRAKEFTAGLAALVALAAGKPVHVCSAAEQPIVRGEAPAVRHHQFAGPHPAGLVGTHIHLIDPVRMGKSVWHIGAQDVIAIGALFLTGMLDSTCVVALGGPQVTNPRLLRTVWGANLAKLVRHEVVGGENRIVSGSVIYGHEAVDAKDYLGRYHQGVCVLAEGRQRKFQGFLTPGFNSFSVKPVFASKLLLGKQFHFNTNLNGSVRDVVPVGSFEAVMPLDIVATFLVRAILSNDLERAELLGILELDGEDMALCTYVCPGKNEYSIKLENMLLQLEKELA